MILQKEQMQRIFAEFKIDINDEQYDRLEKYSDMLCEWNESINLTAITDAEGITIKHFFDSIYPFTLFDVPQGASIIDVGTGAGFPSCPLKIMRDDLRITLLDSLNKRIAFLAHLSETLLLGATCIHGRAEELGKNAEYRESFDIATARAVANLTDLSEYCLPFVKVGGTFAALKGSNASEEVKEAENAIKILGGVIDEVIEYKLPTGDGRTLIIIKKIENTPEKYPRNKGQMNKNKL